MIILRRIFVTVLLVIFSHPAFSQEREIAKDIYRVPLSEAGQSGVCAYSMVRQKCNEIWE